jgi:hypothetical protein
LRIQLFQNDGNGGNEEINYLTSNFDTIFNSRPLILSSVFEIELENPKSITILEYFLIAAIGEKQITDEINGIYEKESRKFALENGKKKYNIMTSNLII